MASQAEQLKLTGRFFSKLRTVGAIGLGGSAVITFGYYLFVYRRRKQIFESYFESLTPDRVDEMANRLARFGVAPSYLPNQGQVESVKQAISGELTGEEASEAAGRYSASILLHDVDTLPAVKKAEAKKAVEAYLDTHYASARSCYDLSRAPGKEDEAEAACSQLKDDLKDMKQFSTGLREKLAPFF